MWGFSFGQILIFFILLDNSSNCLSSRHFSLLNYLPQNHLQLVKVPLNARKKTHNIHSQSLNPTPEKHSQQSPNPKHLTHSQTCNLSVHRHHRFILSLVSAQYIHSTYRQNTRCNSKGCDSHAHERYT